MQFNDRYEDRTSVPLPYNFSLVNVYFFPLDVLSIRSLTKNLDAAIRKQK